MNINPWTVIGWMALIGIAVALTSILIVPMVLAVIRALDRNKRHRRTKSIDPKPGQKWIQDGEPLYITRIHDNGMIGISTAPPNCSGSRASWGESLEDWRKRVKNRKLFLERADA